MNRWGEVRRDVFSVKDHEGVHCFMTRDRRQAENYYRFTRDTALRSGYMRRPRLVHPRQLVVELYVLANGGLDS